MSALHDELWRPRPGSWEEAVDPYDVQSASGPSKVPDADDDVVPRFEALIESQPRHSLPASA